MWGAHTTALPISGYSLAHAQSCGSERTSTTSRSLSEQPLTHRASQIRRTHAHTAECGDNPTHHRPLGKSNRACCCLSCQSASQQRHSLQHTPFLIAAALTQASQRVHVCALLLPRRQVLYVISFVPSRVFPEFSWSATVDVFTSVLLACMWRSKTLLTVLRRRIRACVRFTHLYFQLLTRALLVRQAAKAFAHTLH